ncbi:MAG: hypothetical protein AAB359_06490, partial [Elusimicrobiota bacterium]
NALNALESAVSPSILEEVKAAAPRPHPVQTVKLVVLGWIDVDANNLDDANAKMAEIRDNMPKAGLVYITGRTYKTYDDANNIAYSVTITYAVQKNVPADSVPQNSTIQEFTIYADNETMVQQRLREIKDNLPKAGLVYITATYDDADSTVQTVKITYSRQPIGK